MKKIILSLLLFFIPAISFATDNLNTSTLDNWDSWRNDVLDEVKWNSPFFEVSDYWEKWLQKAMFRVARDLRIIIFTIILLIGIIMVFKLLFWQNTEEEATKFRKWVVWCTIWIIVLQIPFTVYSVMFDKNINTSLASSIENKILQPFIDMLMLIASFAFIAMAIYSFYRIITANWDEEKIKTWKTIIFQAIIWFIVIKIADTLVRNTYTVWCNNWMWITSNCTQNITKNWEIIIKIINWLNSFVALVIVLMIIYAWFLVITWAWDDDKQKKAKNIFIYSWIWLLILFASYLILTFFIIPETTI